MCWISARWIILSDDSDWLWSSIAVLCSSLVKYRHFCPFLLLQVSFLKLFPQSSWNVSLHSTIILCHNFGWKSALNTTLWERDSFQFVKEIPEIKCPNIAPDHHFIYFGSTNPPYDYFGWNYFHLTTIRCSLFWFCLHLWTTLWEYNIHLVHMCWKWRLWFSWTGPGITDTNKDKHPCVLTVITVTSFACPPPF